MLTLKREIYFTCVASMLASLAACTAAPATTCGWKSLSIHAEQPEKRDQYVGRGFRVELRLPNERVDVDPDVFPEAPVVVSQISNGNSCQLPEGGIRVRKSIYLNSDESALLMLEYSGSNEWLAMYDTVSCLQILEIDVSGSMWFLEPEGLVVGSSCKGDGPDSCLSTRIYDLGRGCRRVKKQPAIR